MTALVHGMAGRDVPAARPALDIACVSRALSGYPGLGGASAIAWQSRRPFAASGIVRCAQGSVFVKRHDPRVRDASDLTEEHRFIAHLRHRGAPVPAVLATTDGRTAVAEVDGVYEVHALGEGLDSYRDAPSWLPVRSAADARALGHALGGLHKAAEGYDAPPRRTTLLVAGDWMLSAPDPMAALDARVATDCLLRAALAGRDWRRDVAAIVLPPGRPAPLPPRPRLWVHGDCHASNLLWRDGTVSDVLDFGLCNQASAAWDLATAIERNTIAWLDIADGADDIGRPDLARALLDGYRAVRMQPAGLARILPLVHVEFALSELAYFHAITHDRADADAAYGDFLVGHARWFQAPPGRAFLDALAACG